MSDFTAEERSGLDVGDLVIVAKGRTTGRTIWRVVSFWQHATGEVFAQLEATHQPSTRRSAAPGICRIVVAAPALAHVRTDPLCIHHTRTTVATRGITCPHPSCQGVRPV